MKKFAMVAVLCLPALGQTTYSGLGVYAGAGMYGAWAGTAPTYYATLPQNWVDNTICNPPNGLYDTTVILGTTNNIGPSVQGGPIGSPYPLTYLGLRDAMNNWRDNADNASQTPHFADRWWLIEVPAGTNLHGPNNLTSGYDANNALISLPGKVNGGVEPTKCLVIDSTAPLTTGVMACGRGLPGFGGTRNPGCSSPNDKASMWKVQLDGPLTALGRSAVYAGGDVVTPTNWVNHVVLRNIEVTEVPGAAQSGPNVHAPYLFRTLPNITGAAPCSTATPCIVATHIGLDRYYIHGWDPGDPGQPSGACSTWTNTSGSGTGVSVAPDSANPGTSLVTIPSTGYTGSYFGMTFQPGSTIAINGTAYTIANTSYTQANLVGTGNSQLSIAGNVTLSNASFTESNPPAQYANGCGDDVVWGATMNCDYCWRQNGYIEKIHWWLSESHASQQGFSNGPYKDVNNWEEGGSAAWFNGGGPVDQQGGPTYDQEVRRNYFGRDLNYRQLTGSAGASPAPPWGCGTADSHSSHNTCPFSWAIKNSVELKLGHRVLMDGNIVENSWADGQTGWCVVVGPRACSGGAACGIFDSVTGLPKTAIDNIRFSNNWIRNCPEPLTTGGRSGPIGDGGGLSLPANNNDYINNLLTNINDLNQTGNPNDQWVWGDNSNHYHCTMSYTGSGPYTVTAQCVPYQQDITNKITKIVTTSPGNVQILYGAGAFGNGLRMDPMLSSGPSGTCIANGNSWTTCPVVISNHAGWNGSFAMTGAGSNWAADGTGGSGIAYMDSINNPSGTLCDNGGSPTCTALLNSGDVTFASLAFKMTDISIGDGIYAYNVGGGDTTCATNGYAAGGYGTAPVYAISGTITTGLTVVYQIATQPSASSAACILDNGSGQPRFITLQNQTELCPGPCSLQLDNTWQHSVNNQIFNNVWVDNDPAHASYMHCMGIYEGMTSLECWDMGTLQFYNNVLEGRDASYWGGTTGVVPVPGIPSTQANNYIPAQTSAWSAATGGGSCVYDGSNPFNCPLMALPWANNFTLGNVAAMTGSVTQGASIPQVSNAMTQTQYQCPSGANCGAHGPYPD